MGLLEEVASRRSLFDLGAFQFEKAHSRLWAWALDGTAAPDISRGLFERLTAQPVPASVSLYTTTERKVRCASGSSRGLDVFVEPDTPDLPRLAVEMKVDADEGFPWEGHSQTRDLASQRVLAAGSSMSCWPWWSPGAK